MDKLLVSICILGVIGIVIQFLTRKQKEDEKSNIVSGIQYLAMGLVVVISLFSQDITTNKDTRYKKANLEINVLSQISELHVPTFKNLFTISNNYDVMIQYYQLKKVRESIPKVHSSLLTDLKLQPKRKDKLEKIKKALSEIKEFAAKIIELNLQHPNIIPSEAITWSSITLKIKIDNLDEYFNVYSKLDEPPKKSVQEYFDNFGKMAGLIIGKIRKASTDINKL